MLVRGKTDARLLVDPVVVSIDAAPGLGTRALLRLRTCRVGIHQRTDANARAFQQL